MIGRLPYYYFLLLVEQDFDALVDWNTAVFIPPSTYRHWRSFRRLEDCRITTSFYCINICATSKAIGRLPYYYFLLLRSQPKRHNADWKTAVLLLPFTRKKPYRSRQRLEDCRITTSFYSFRSRVTNAMIGRLPYYYFLLLLRLLLACARDWKTAVLLLPFTYQ